MADYWVPRSMHQHIRPGFSVLCIGATQLLLHMPDRKDGMSSPWELSLNGGHRLPPRTPTIAGRVKRSGRDAAQADTDVSDLGSVEIARPIP